MIFFILWPGFLKKEKKGLLNTVALLYKVLFKMKL